MKLVRAHHDYFSDKTAISLQGGNRKEIALEEHHKRPSTRRANSPD